MSKKPLFLVYIDHPMCSIDCADGIAEVLNRSGLYEARFIGPDSPDRTPLSKEILEEADCVVFGGGLGDSDQFDDRLLDYRSLIRNYVAKGGRYLGICMGSYFAGYHYFDLLANNTKAVQYVTRPDSTVKRETYDVVTLSWEGKDKTLYFHDGAAFVPSKGFKTISGDVIAKYQNGDAAALIQDYKKGRVAVVGPHPEAHSWWFYSQSRIHNRWHDCVHHDLALDLVSRLMQ